MPPAQDAGATRALTRFIKTSTPFRDLYAASDKQNKAFRGWLCFYLDLAVRLIAVLILLGIVAGVAWKAIGPLPRFTW